MFNIKYKILKKNRSVCYAIDIADGTIYGTTFINVTQKKTSNAVYTIGPYVIFLGLHIYCMI